MARGVDEDLARRLRRDVEEVAPVGPRGIGAEQADQRLVREIGRAQRRTGHLAQGLRRDRAHVRIHAFDQCFARCTQFTERTKEQCFDACNK